MQYYDAGMRVYEAPAPGEHDGLTAEGADQRARALVKHAASSGTWKFLPEHLTRLREIAAEATKDGL